MNFDIQTLAFISSLTFLCQLIALFIQYVVNKSYRGVVWWLIGSAFWAVGVILMPLVSVKSVAVFARIANPMIILGQIFLYIGMARFVNRKENIWVLLSITIIPILFYYYFMFVFNDITSRTLSLMVPFTTIALMTASTLYINKDRYISISANFTTLVFVLFACFSFFRIFWLIASPPMKTYSDQGTILELTFIIPIVAGLLWTFGFIIMVNQRLNGEISEEKEKLQLIFNTSPDAAIISRLEDGAIVDVNAGFLRMTGYTRADVINNSTINVNIWNNALDRDYFVKELLKNGICENQE